MNPARTTRVTTTAAAPRPSAVQPSDAEPTAWTSPRTCSPISRKTAPSSAVAIVRQFCWSDSRCCGVEDRALFRPTTTPAATAAIGPDAPISSVGSEAMNGSANERRVPTAGSPTLGRILRPSLATT